MYASKYDVRLGCGHGVSFRHYSQDPREARSEIHAVLADNYQCITCGETVKKKQAVVTEPAVQPGKAQRGY